MNEATVAGAAERIIRFACEDAQLIGILHQPTVMTVATTTAVVVVVGGPQYRVGSHRQFVLLARQLAAVGIPVLRFDYRGMGDSEGLPRDFEQIDADIHAACEALCRELPTVQRIVLWGLCDAASAALFYASSNPRVAGLVLLNPWLRQAQAQAKTVIQHYYKQRLFSTALWRKLLRGDFAFRASVASFLATLRQARRGTQSRAMTTVTAGASLSERMATGWRNFNGAILLILAGDDLVAKEFETVVTAAPEWQGLMAGAQVRVSRMAGATHTFSRQEWRDTVAEQTIAFIREGMAEKK